MARLNGFLSKNNGAHPSGAGISKLVIEGIVNLDRGLRIVGENVDFAEIKIALLGIDTVGRLVILEASDREEDSILVRIIDDFDWVFNHTEEIRKRFSDFDIDISLSPRVIVVLPQFSQELLKRITYLGYIDLQLYTYRIVNHTVPQNVVFELASFSSRRKFVKGLEEKTVEDLLNYIENAAVKNICQKVLDEARRLLPQANLVTSGGYISIQLKGKESIGIYPHRNFFWFNVSRNVWQGIHVHNAAQIDNITSEIKSVMEVKNNNGRDISAS